MGTRKKKKPKTLEMAHKLDDSGQQIVPTEKESNSTDEKITRGKKKLKSSDLAKKSDSEQPIVSTEEESKPKEEQVKKTKKPKTADLAQKSEGEAHAAFVGKRKRILKTTETKKKKLKSANNIPVISQEAKISEDAQM